MPNPSGFAYTRSKNGEVVITHKGRQASILRGHVAEKFMSDIAKRDPQLVMARITGNYKRGNERAE